MLHRAQHFAKRKGGDEKHQMENPLQHLHLRDARRVGNVERQYLRSPYLNLSLCARIRGDIPENDLRRALDKVRIIHPLVGAKVVFDEDGGTWFSTDDVLGSMLRVVPRKSDSQWFGEVQYESSVPFDPSAGPLIRFVLVYSPEVSDLIVFAKHEICDGRALAFLIRDILMHVVDPLLEAKTIVPPIYADCFPKSFKRVIIQNILKPLIFLTNKRWSKSRWIFDQEDYLNIHKAFWDRYTYNIVLLQLEKDETERLIETCRDYEITVGSATTTVYVAALNNVCGRFRGHQKYVGMAYDLRDRIDKPVGDAFCLFIASFQYKFDYDPKKSFWENARTFHRRARKKLDARDVYGLVPEFDRFDPTLIADAGNFVLYAEDVPEGFSRYDKPSSFARDKNNVAFQLFKLIFSAFPGTWTSNLGRLDFPETYGGLRLEWMFFAPQSALSGVSVGSRTTFALNYMEDSFEGVEVQKATQIEVRNRMLEYLGFPEKTNNSAL